ncbi:hypothetical protein MKEN_00582000 [Mycena kentingensis (nom. inval.)]|nr:hypothetical protein MKEN_00582000 [Mycena kentingensis (nom. inval.)]
MSPEVPWRYLSKVPENHSLEVPQRYSQEAPEALPGSTQSTPRKYAEVLRHSTLGYFLEVPWGSSTKCLELLRRSTLNTCRQYPKHFQALPQVLPGSERHSLEVLFIQVRHFLEVLLGYFLEALGYFQEVCGVLPGSAFGVLPGSTFTILREDDLATLRAMCLTSKALREIAREPLFSVIRLAGEVDFDAWLDLLRQTPSLVGVVRMVKISASLADAPTIPPFPGVQHVEWIATVHWDTALAASYTKTMFPATTRLSLTGITFKDGAQLTALLDACTPLVGLTFRRSSISPIPGAADPESMLPDMSHLRELTFIENYNGGDRIGGMFAAALWKQPSQLRILRFISGRDLPDIPGSHPRNPCSGGVIFVLLRASASTLTRLTINPIQGDTHTDNIFLLFSIPRLPELSALTHLTIHLAPIGYDSYYAEHFFGVLKPLPLLTTLRFILQVALGANPVDYEWLSNLFAQTPHALTLARLPALRVLVFGFCAAPRGSTASILPETGYRDKMDGALRSRLQGIGIAQEILAEILRIEWLDRRYRPLS